MALRPHVQADVDRLVAAALREGDLDGGANGSGAGRRRATRGRPGIPMIGGASGAIPGTTPHRQRRLDYWSGR